MGREHAGAAGAEQAADLESPRLTRTGRREALIEVAARLVATGPVEEVSIEAVAEAAGVSRPLIYKHFANRGALLTAVYQREIVLLHTRLAGEVERAGTLEAMFRALVRGVLHAEAQRGATLAALRAGGGWDPALRRDRRARDRITVRYFTARAVAELGLDETRARTAVIVALGAIEPVLAHWRHDPGPQQAAQLEDAYVALALGGLTRLAAQRAPDPAAGP
ncbi:hypothetical protein DPM19_02060 [Actinomadura craniellae]|uniref:HTH tetR-type domain-containing protein n=1 Tax=Actinomadura craniellae TaxID=2231787 RepID=A0A365HCY8_9ACTN|nr:TetR/AcrR family transcriptional regulator [Actinomadura craniellae]RAY16971.1 hypothetical protein DPM19_02060 [Actinomadura craniellae]